MKIIIHNIFIITLLLFFIHVHAHTHCYGYIHSYEPNLFTIEM